MTRLKEELRDQGPIYIAIIGAGLMGSYLLAGLEKLDHIKVALVASRHIDKIKSLCQTQDIKDYQVVHDQRGARRAFDQGQLAITENTSLAWSLEGIHCLVDCTGNPQAGAEIAFRGLENKKHVVSFNVECDVLVGHKLQALARDRGLCYTLAAGDEPSAIMELYDFADFIGLEVLALGKGKNNPLHVEATPESLKEEAQKKGVSPRMLTSFVDATNTMLELNVVANATGFVPDVRGCHGIHAKVDSLKDSLTLEEEGGPLKTYGVLEYVHGIAPGVFALVHSDSKKVQEEMAYLSMGPGPNYILYRPYHLTSLEAPISIAKAVLRQEETISHSGQIVAQTVAIAKRDIGAGEALEGIGSKTVYGQLEKASVAQEEDLLPISLIQASTRARVPIKKGQAIHMDQVDLGENTFLQELYFKK
ncbi:MAG: NAD(P)-dependent oxidoreductase [Tissierellia bacterium]|nr:NAD(P)-dependent oxidoreductase [Tissierellia bacterium]